MKIRQEKTTDYNEVYELVAGALEDISGVIDIV